MKRIEKGKEPRELLAWKRRQAGVASYAALLEVPATATRPRLYDRVLHALLQEQGYLCGYCMERVEWRTDSRKQRHPSAQQAAAPTRRKQACDVEHIKPQADCAAGEDVAWNNLIASCLGTGKSDSYSPRTCNAHRGRAPLPISPLDHDCERFFVFDMRGRMRPEKTLSPRDRARAHKTIEVLGLDTLDDRPATEPWLRRQRREAIAEWLEPEDDKTFPTPTQLRALRKRAQERDANGQFLHFAVAITQVIDQHLQANPQKAAASRRPRTAKRPGARPDHSAIR